jgi:hypothetical protein
MSILNYCVASYIISTGTERYVHGYYDTLEVAQRVCNNYNVMFKNGGNKLTAKVERA